MMSLGQAQERLDTRQKGDETDPRHDEGDRGKEQKTIDIEPIHHFFDLVVIEVDLF